MVQIRCSDLSLSPFLYTCADNWVDITVSRAPGLDRKYANRGLPIFLATSNDPWGPTGTDMSEIAAMTFGR